MRVAAGLGSIVVCAASLLGCTEGDDCADPETQSHYALDAAGAGGVGGFAGASASGGRVGAGGSIGVTCALPRRAAPKAELTARARRAR